MISVPYRLGRQLRTVVDSPAQLVENLGHCVACAFVATVSAEDFLALGMAETFGAYDEHRRSMQRQGYDVVAAELINGLGADVYRELVDAIRPALRFRETRRAGRAKRSA